MFELIDPTTGLALMRWTVRLAVVCILVRFALRLSAADRRTPSRGECWSWAVGYLLYVCHVLLAFHFVHGWSHDQAWQHTADETARLTGIHRGEGIWVNYAFTLIWGLDVLRLVAARYFRRPTSRVLDVASFVIFGFICFNATVVFGPVHYRWLAIGLLFAVFLLWRRIRASAGSPLQ